MRAALILAGVILCLDQVTKYWAAKYLAEVDSLPIIPSFFSLRLVWNKGIAFGLFSQHGKIIVFVCLLALVAVFLLCRPLATKGRGFVLALGLVAGGSVGNLLDRIFRPEGVIDFLDFHIGSHHWPAFNLADAAITLAFFFLLFRSIRREKNGEGKSNAIREDNGRESEE